MHKLLPKCGLAWADGSVDVVLHRKVDVAHLDQLRVLDHGLDDRLASERVLTQTLLDLEQDRLVLRVADVEHRRQVLVLGTETVEEVRAEDPRHVGVRDLLDCNIVWKAISFFLGFRKKKNKQTYHSACPT